MLTNLPPLFPSTNNTNSTIQQQQQQQQQQQPQQPQQLHSSSPPPPTVTYDPNGVILHEPYPAMDAVNHRFAKFLPPSHEECHLIRRLRLTFPDTTTIVLPVESLEEQPRFVNSRQYHRIVTRRSQRNKQGLPARLPNGERVKVKYASRQQHAYRRGRGAGGQFLKKGEVLLPRPHSAGHLPSGLLDSDNFFDFTHDGIKLEEPDEDDEGSILDD